MTGGRWRAASSASTDSSAAIRASGIRTWCTTTTRWSRPRRRMRATTSPRTWSTSRCSSSPTPSRSIPTSPSTCTSASAPRTPPTMWPRSGRTSTQDSSTTAGTPTGRRSSPRRRSSAIVPADTELSRHDPDVPDWDSLPEPSRRLFSRMMEVFAGFLSHTDHHLGRLLDFLRERGDLDNTIVMVISDNGASAEGGPTGTTNEAQFFNNAPESLEDSLARIDEIGGPTTFNHYPWGWTWAGNTPFRRWKRETYRGGVSDPFIVSWPQGIAAKGEVRTQYAHIIDMVPTVLDVLGIEPPATIRGVTQSPLQGVSFAKTFDDAERRERPPHAVLRDARPPGHLPRRMARRLSVAGALVHRGRHGVRAADLGRQALRSRRFGLGALPRRRGLRGEQRCRGGAPRQADRPHRHLVRRGRQVRRHARRRQRPAAHDRREAPGGRARTATHTSRARSRSRSSPARGCSTGRTASPPRSRSPTAAPRASC